MSLRNHLSRIMTKDVRWMKNYFECKGNSEQKGDGCNSIADVLRFY